MNTTNIQSTSPSAGRIPPSPRVPQFRALFSVAIAMLVTACTTSQTSVPPSVQEPESQKLRAGDIIKVSFPRSPSLDAEQQIRRDGKVNLGLIGHVQAADLTPAELEKQLQDKYASQLVSNEVHVTVISSAFSVYVSGAVLKPGKITPERNLTPFQAVMEAGGFDPGRANTRSVVVIGEDGTRYTVDLDAFIAGRKIVQPFLRANDTVYVPERRSIF